MKEHERQGAGRAAPRRSAAAGRAGPPAEADRLRALRDMAARQLAARIEAGELSAAELLKVMGLPEAAQGGQPAAGGRDYLIELQDDG